MKKMTKIIPVALLALWLAVTPALGATPGAFVKGILDEVLAIQTNPALEGPGREADRAQAIRRVIQKSFDFPYMAEQSLGAAYERLNPGQRQEFTQVFTSLFQTSYTNMVLRFLKKETVKYGKENVTGARPGWTPPWCAPTTPSRWNICSARKAAVGSCMTWWWTG